MMGTIFRPSPGRIKWGLGLTALFTLLLVACGESDTLTSAPTQPSPTPTHISATSSETPEPNSTSTSRPTEPGPTPTPKAVVDKQRTVGQVEGVTFVVGAISEATFTVEEKLAYLPLPGDAVVRTTALSGEVHLDGRPSVVEINLHQLESDQSRRDSYIRGRMFPNDPIATFTLDDPRPLPDGFTEGEVVTTHITGQLTIRGVQVPIIFDVEARDDGDVIFILGRTSFIWADFGMSAPSFGSFVSVTD